MLSYSLASEQSRKAHVRRHLIFRYHLIATFGLADDEFADLSSVSFLMRGFQDVRFYLPAIQYR
jgi:hypothetical protein